jgi:hypothetical protein
VKLEKIGTGGKAEQRKHLRSAWHLGSSQSFHKSKATVKKRTETKKQKKKYQLPRFAKGKAAVSALSRAVEFCRGGCPAATLSKISLKKDCILLHGMASCGTARLCSQCIETSLES